MKEPTDGRLVPYIFNGVVYYKASIVNKLIKELENES